MNQFKKLAGQTVIYGLSSVVGRFLNFLLIPLLTRPEWGGFTTEQYGVVTEMYAYVAFLAILLTYGIEIAFFRFSQKEKNSEKVFSTSLISLITTSSIFIGLIFLQSKEISNFIQYPENPEYVKWFAIIIGLDAISSISFAKLRQKNKAFRFAYIKLINILFNIGFLLFFIVICPNSSSEFIQSIYDKNIGVGYVFISNLIASILTIVMLMPEMIKCSWSFDKDLWKKLMIYSLPLLFASLAGIINETFDKILLKHFLINMSPEKIMSEIGIYGALYKISIIMTLFIQAFRYAAEPFFFAYEEKKDSKKIYASLMKYFIIITSIIFLITTIYYDLIKHFVGEDFRDDRGFLIVSILLFANLLLGIYYNLSIWYKLSEKTIYGAYLSFFGAIITITLNILLIPKIGIIGSSLATVICYLSMTIYSYYLGSKHYPIKYPIKEILSYLGFVILIYICSQYILDFGMIINTVYIVIFVLTAIILERSKIKVS